MESVDEAARRQIGRRIAQARKEAGLTQQQLAELLVVHKRSVENYEKDRVPWALLEDIGKITGRSREWFLRGDDASDEIREAVRAEIQDLEERVEDVQRLLSLLLERAAQGPDTNGPSPED